MHTPRLFPPSSPTPSIAGAAWRCAIGAVLLATASVSDAATSGPVSFTADNQTISGLTIVVPVGSATPAVTLSGHKGCKLLNCLIKHQLGDGVLITGGSDDYTIDTCNIICKAAPARGQNPNPGMLGICVVGSARGKINNVRVENCSTGIWMVGCSHGPAITWLEGHDMRGPIPRGQLIQADNSPNGSLSDFSIVNDRNIAWTEDCINIYESNGWSISRGLIDGNNSPFGDNIIFEGYGASVTSSGSVDQVDAINFGNGAFSTAGAQNIVFTNCRADHLSLASWQGRGTPSSNGLIFGAIDNGSTKSANITYASTCHWGPNAGTNLAWQEPEMHFNATGPVAFTPRSALSLVVPTDGAVNHPPVANAQSVSTPSGVAKAITLSGSDVDGNPLTYAIVANPTHGTLSGSGNSRTYAPSAGYAGADDFTFTVNDGTATSATATVSITVTAASAWTTRDVGGTRLTGSTSQSGGTWTLKGSGSDIWGSADAFQFASQPLTGDGSIVARVVSVQNTNGWAKAGVMIRQGTAAGAKHAFCCVTPGNGTAFQRRITTDGASSHTAGSRASAPRWVKMVRRGMLVTGYESADGVTWSTVGSVAISLTDPVQIGLAVTSHDNGVLCTAVFDRVVVTPGGSG